MKEITAKDDYLTLNHSIREISERIKSNYSIIRSLREKNILVGLGTIILNLTTGLMLPEIAGFCLMASSLAYIVYFTSNVNKTKSYKKNINRLKRLQMSYELELEEKNRLVENHKDALVKEQNIKEEKCIKNISNIYNINEDILEDKPMQLRRKK